MWAWLVLSVAIAGTPDRPVSLGADLGFTAGSGATGATGAGRVLVNLRPISFEIGAAEGYLAGTQRQVGRVFLGVRRYLWKGSYVRGSFSHAHEVPWEQFKAAPLQAIAGVGDAIMHRSGAELGLGWLLDVPTGGDGNRLHVAVDASCQWYPDRGGPPLYCGLSLGALIDVGRRRQAKHQSAEPAAPPEGS